MRADGPAEAPTGRQAGAAIPPAAELFSAVATRGRSPQHDMSWLRDVVGRAFDKAARAEHARARKVARAREYLEKNDANEARLELEGVEGEEAAALRGEALMRLVALNLEEVRFRTNSGERTEADSALARAKAFGATPEQLASVRASRAKARATGGTGGPPA